MADRTRIEKLQMERLRSLVVELHHGNAFYRDRLKKAGMESGPSSLAEFTEKMPFTTKMDLVWDREEFSQYGSNLTYPLDSY